MVYRDVEVPRLFVGLLLILVLRGVKINKRDKLGRTAIHIAAQQGTPGYAKCMHWKAKQANLTFGFIV
jgi:ankyrin repeat protein